MKYNLFIGAMGLNKEVQRCNLRCSTMQVKQYCQKPSEVPLNQLARPTKLQDWSSEQTKCNQKIHVALSTKPLDRASPCFGRAKSLILLGCCFWLFKYLGLFHYHLFIALMYLKLLSVISPINRELLITYQDT